MWRIIICAVLLLVATAANGQQLEEKPTSNIVEKEKDPPPPASALGETTVIIQELSTTPPSLPTNKPTEIPSQLASEVTKPPLEVESPSATLPVEQSEEENTIVDPKRRVITYDQRQEGQYNIRADLENFMIVFIPPSPVDGVNLIDLLSKSTKRTKSSHKKYHPESGSKYRQSLKSGAGSQNFNFLARHHQSQQSQSPHIIIEEHQPSARIAEYIEGRTPYRVDISSTHSDLEQLQQEHHQHQQQQQQFQQQQPHGPQVDVLPPPYPLSYHHLIKPFHLEAEPTVIQALPPQSAQQNSGSKFMDSNGNFFRMARAIQGGLYGLLSLDSNRVQPRQRTIFDEQLLSTLDDDDSDDNEEVGESRTVDLPLTNDRLEEAVHNYVYPPLNPLRFNPEILDLHSRSMHSSSQYPKYPRPIQNGNANANNDDDDDDNDNTSISESSNSNESAKTTEIELKLLGATEECGPDRKRDSYGICRFAEGY
ncbi:probable serine/threonine-protein kinase tsuA [Eupeodes corollae]|uniref:probable serine/threonine-protein kinase tsuA n=1 Tax=Eupeodes corollae TaxID=290404 RepID=UPI00249344AC|nr:probable serine/threonine-protein kinase tsuA [Eupeodes corollae]